MLELKIKLHEGGIMPQKFSKGDWIDLAIPEDIEVKAFSQYLIDLKIAMELPEGYEAHILPRSSTFLKYGIILTNGMGIIDNSYSGDKDTWKALIYPFKDEFIPRGTRLFQFRIVKTQPDLNFTQVETLGNADRGGYGSTGA